MKKQLGSALLCALLVLALCACAPSKGEDVSKFDAVTYVDGLIKENYLDMYQTWKDFGGGDFYRG